MAGTIPVTCPECKKQLQVAAALDGKKIRCKQCGAVMPVKAPSKPVAKSASAKPPATPAKPPAPKAPAPVAPRITFDDEDNSGPATYAFSDNDAAAQEEKKPAGNPLPAALGEESNPYDVTETAEGIRCPHCAKDMEEGQIVCLHCGYNTRTRTHGFTRRTYQITTGDRFLWLLPGILCVVFILALIGFDVYFWVGLKEAWWDPMDGWMENTSFSMGLRVWELIFSLWLMYMAGKFAFNRLVVNPRPPEIEKK